MKRASSQTQSEITNTCMHTCGHTHTHTSEAEPCEHHSGSGPSVTLSVSPPFSVLPLTCKCGLFCLIHSRGDHYRRRAADTQSRLGLLSRRGPFTHSTSLLINGRQTPLVPVMAGAIDLPSFDVVQEGDLDVHQERQQRHLKAIGQ